jgi:hypothetical protein
MPVFLNFRALWHRWEKQGKEKKKKERRLRFPDFMLLI